MVEACKETDYIKMHTTKYMVTGRGEVPDRSIKENNYTFQKVERFKYLGSIMASKNDMIVQN